MARYGNNPDEIGSRWAKRHIAGAFGQVAGAHVLGFHPRILVSVSPSHCCLNGLLSGELRMDRGLTHQESDHCYEDGHTCAEAKRVLGTH